MPSQSLGARLRDPQRAARQRRQRRGRAAGPGGVPYASRPGGPQLSERACGPPQVLLPVRRVRGPGAEVGEFGGAAAAQRRRPPPHQLEHASPGFRSWELLHLGGRGHQGDLYGLRPGHRRLVHHPCGSECGADAHDRRRVARSGRGPPRRGEAHPLGRSASAARGAGGRAGEPGVHDGGRGPHGPRLHGAPAPRQAPAAECHPPVVQPDARDLQQRQEPRGQRRGGSGGHALGRSAGPWRMPERLLGAEEDHGAGLRAPVGHRVAGEPLRGFAGLHPGRSRGWWFCHAPHEDAQGARLGAPDAGRLPWYGGSLCQRSHRRPRGHGPALVWLALRGHGV
mmetsp:Transcript_13931/g.43497  ORF Transcript_13931/g.43497 Transcript_13931/m.43497 type:complete len:339 (-) Transcript_13931:109-1125(-)